jgi:hypothetical protein
MPRFSSYHIVFGFDREDQSERWTWVFRGFEHVLRLLDNVKFRDTNPSLPHFRGQINEITEFATQVKVLGWCHANDQPKDGQEIIFSNRFPITFVPIT